MARMSDGEGVGSKELEMAGSGMDADELSGHELGFNFRHDHAVVVLLNQFPGAGHIEADRHRPGDHRLVNGHRSSLAPERAFADVERKKDRARLHSGDDLGLNSLKAQKFEVEALFGRYSPDRLDESSGQRPFVHVAYAMSEAARFVRF